MEKLAIEGGKKARTKETKEGAKYGIEELMELVKLWGLKPDTEEVVRSALEKAWTGRSPHLFRYYHPDGDSMTRRFEIECSKFFGVPYVLATNSCTSSLIAALVAAGVGPGTEVIVPAHTFFASASAIVVAKAIPVIAEIDDSHTIDPIDVERKITPQTRAIIVVHIKGLPCNMDAIMDIARKYNLVVVEDVAQAAGGWYKGKRLGTIGDIGCFSLDHYKVIASGEGGIMTFKEEWFYTRAQSYHDTAACWRPNRYERERKEGELFAGENYRMSELQAAVAYAQIKKLGNIVENLRKSYKKIVSKLDLPEGVRTLKDNDPDGGCRYVLGLLWQDKEMANAARDALKAEGIWGSTHDTDVRDWHVYRYWEHILEKKTATKEGCPYTCPYYKGKLPDYSPDMCPNTIDYLSRSLFVGISPHFSDEDCQQIAHGINKVAKILAERKKKNQALLHV
ncbi:MAG TPA: DegT/DnrJ/EryC1/StrS family aminotransferase [bacterium]|nr:DegT/DnrJ/EryC1/StrS family aminotransferase [bacterium]HOL50028.1 DegT/DnrJ/EryC1/StrS family aminotransferase [bacterium]HPO51524.1 DegT/DnrJ/EryC1/StrS family aminotransferase [bacterium]